MSTVAPNWNACSVQKFAGNQPATRNTKTPAAMPYTIQATSKVAPIGSFWRTRRMAGGRLISDGSGPARLMKAMAAGTLNTPTASATQTSVVTAAPARMARA